jgi:hypothetical protein
MAETFTLDEVATLLNTVMSGIRQGGVDDRVYSLEEVAARTHWSLETLKDDCIAGRINHTRRGRQRGMSSSQIAEAILQHTTGASFDDKLTALVRTDAGQVRPGSRRRAGRAA